MTKADVEVKTAKDDKDDKGEKETNWLRWGVKIGLAICLLWLATLALFLWDVPYLPGIDVGDRGTFGDMFGGLTSLFTGLAFAGVVISILMQKEELHLTREDVRSQTEELKLTRKQVEAQRKQMELQNTYIKQQMFEATLFRLLEYKQTVLRNLSVATPEDGVRVSFTGLDAISYLNKKMLNLWTGPDHKIDTVVTRPSGLLGGKIHLTEEYDDIERLRKIYDNLYNSHKTEYAHYIKAAYAITKLFADDLDQLRKYKEIITSQLAIEESILLLHHAIWSEESAELTYLNRIAGIFQDVPPERVLPSTASIEIGDHQPSPAILAIIHPGLLELIGMSS